MKRGRYFERSMSYEYIQSLNKAYNNFFNHYTGTPLLIINTTTMDFVQNENDFQKIMDLLTSDIQGTVHYDP